MQITYNIINESFNNKFIKDIILNNEYLKYIPGENYKYIDIVEILRNHTTYGVYENNSIYYKIVKAYNDLFISYSKLLNFNAYNNNLQINDITTYLSKNKEYIIKDQNILAIRVKEVKIKFNNFIKLMNDFINGTFNASLDTPEAEKFINFTKLKNDQIQDITDIAKQNLNGDTLDFYIVKTLKPTIQEQKANVMIYNKSNNSITLFCSFNHDTPYILGYNYSPEYIKNKSSLKKIKKYWKDILKNDITTYKIDDNYEIPLFKNIRNFKNIQDEFINFIDKNNKLRNNNSYHGYPLSIMYDPIKEGILNNSNIYILNMNSSLKYKSDNDIKDIMQNNKSVIIKNKNNNYYYHPLKNELIKFIDMIRLIYSGLFVSCSDVVNDETTYKYEHLFRQLKKYNDNFSYRFVMSGTLNYNEILMYNRIYDILNRLEPLVIYVYNIIYYSNKNLSSYQLNRIIDISNKIEYYDKIIGKIISKMTKYS